MLTLEQSMHIYRRQKRSPDTIQKPFVGPLIGYQVKHEKIIPSHCGEYVSPWKLSNPVSTVRNCIVLNDKINMEDESKTPVESRKYIIWQTYISDQRPKLRVHINDIVIEGIIDLGTDRSIITP